MENNNEIPEGNEQEKKEIQIVYLPIDGIKPYADNPRKNDLAVDVVKTSIQEFGFKNPIIIDQENVIIAGHTRLLAAKDLAMERVPVIYAKDLTPEQVNAFRIMDNKSSEYAEWDYELLKASVEVLKSSGYDLEATGLSEKEIEKMFQIDLDNQYTEKIVIPIYEPKGDKPKLSELLDMTKTNKLIEDIMNSNLDDETKNFLKAASMRHMVFKYDKIAEYYAHADKETKELMEKSALVIIDYDKAVEQGFVDFVKDIFEVEE